MFPNLLVLLTVFTYYQHTMADILASEHKRSLSSAVITGPVRRLVVFQLADVGKFEVSTLSTGT
jgi:hypothetical protein